MIKGLVPRLNYDFPISKVIYGLYSILKKDPDISSIKNLFNNENIYFLNHARSGLRLLLNSLGLPPDSRIGVQAFNCITVFEAIKKAGHKPVFLDINNTFTIDTNDLKSKKDKLDAIIVTHTFGIPANIDKIRDIVTNIPMIEDCAHSFLSKYKGSYTGTCGDASIFSFGNAKFPALGGGGMVLINNNSIINNFKLNYRKLKNENFLKTIFILFKNNILYFLHRPILYKYFTKPLKQWRKNEGFNHKEYKINKVNLNLLLNNFVNYHLYLKKQQKNVSYILDFINKDILSTIKEKNSEWNGFMVPILINYPNKLMQEAKKRGIEFGSHFANSLNWAKEYGYNNGSCPNIEKIIKKLITIPSHYNIKPKQMLLIKRFLENYFYESIN